jgi:hypothetical protein
MPDPRQFAPERLRVVLDHGEVVELDGGTLVLDNEEFPSVVLRLAPWRARSVARVLAEWSSVSRIFHPSTRSCLDELELSRTLELAAAVSGGDEEPIVRSSLGSPCYFPSATLSRSSSAGRAGGAAIRGTAPSSGRCRLVVAFGTRWRRGVCLRTACCELRGGGHYGTRLPRPDRSIRRTR